VQCLVCHAREEMAEIRNCCGFGTGEGITVEISSTTPTESVEEIVGAISPDLFVIDATPTRSDEESVSPVSPGRVVLAKPRIGVVTWNVGNHAMDATNMSPFVEPGAPDLDIIAFGAQECEYSEKKAEYPTGSEEPTFINGVESGTKWHHWFGVIQAHLGQEWAPVQAASLLEMRLIVFARKTHAQDIKVVEYASEATGLLGLVGNKGGLIVRFLIYDTSVAFISCHLAAHEGPKYVAQRNDNVDEVLGGGARLGVSQLDIMAQTDHVFWMGDLNYRIDPFVHGLCPKPEKGHPKSGTPEHKAIGDRVREMLAGNSYEELLKHDELREEMAQRRVLSTFKEGEIAFAPTFKVVPARKYEKDAPGKDPTADPVQYTQQRWPAWCDRILTNSRPHVQGCLNQVEYTSCPTVMSSDHKPVKAIYEATMYAALPPTPSVQPAGAPDLWFSNMSGSGLKAVDVSGKSDPYLFFWCPDIGITQKNSSCGVAQNASRAKKQTLEPVWTDEEVPLVKCMTYDKVRLENTHVVVGLCDHDTFDADDAMGSATLLLKDFMQEGGADFTVDMLCNAVPHGTLCGHLEIVWPSPDGTRRTRKGPGGCGCSVM